MGRTLGAVVEITLVNGWAEYMEHKLGFGIDCVRDRIQGEKRWNSFKLFRNQALQAGNDGRENVENEVFTAMVLA
jgi:hypothetical protein